MNEHAQHAINTLMRARVPAWPDAKTVPARTWECPKCTRVVTYGAWAAQMWCFCRDWAKPSCFMVFSLLSEDNTCENPPQTRMIEVAS
jgi:hypothetical protein